MCMRMWLVEVKFVPLIDLIIISHFMWIIVFFRRAIFHALFFNQIYLSTHLSIYKRFFRLWLAWDLFGFSRPMFPNLKHLLF